MGILDILVADKVRRNRLKDASDVYSGLLGAPDQQATPDTPFSIGGRMHVALPGTGTEAQAGSGYLGSDRGLDAQRQLRAGMISAGYNPAEVGSILGQQVKPQNPTSLIQNMVAAGVDLNSPEGQTKLLEAIMKPTSQTNINMSKLPANYMAVDPNDLSKGVKPIPGGPATKPTAAEAKQMGQADLVKAMLGEIQTIADLPDFDVSSQSTWARTELAKMPMTSWMVNLTPNEAKIASNLTQFENQYMAMLRGAQVGPAEQKMFVKQLPQIGQDTALFNENLRNSKRNMRVLMDKMIKARQFTPDNAPIPPPGFEVIP